MCTRLVNAYKCGRFPSKVWRHPLYCTRLQPCAIEGMATKVRMEPSGREEKIRGNDVFLLTLLTLHWIHLSRRRDNINVFFTVWWAWDKVWIESLLPIINILLRLIFIIIIYFFFAAVSECIPSNRVCESNFLVYDARNAPRSDTFDLSFLFICL